MNRLRTLTTFPTGDPAFDRYQQHVKATLTPILQNPLLGAVDFRWNEIPGTLPAAATFALQYRSGTAWNTIAAFDATGRVQAPSPVAASMTQTVAQTLTGGVTAVVNFDAVDYDTDHALTTGASSRFTCPVGKDGKYHIDACVALAPAPVSTLGNVWAYKNGILFRRLAFKYQEDATAVHRFLIGADVVPMVAGDFIDIRVQDGAGTNGTNGDATNRDTKLVIYRIPGG